ARIFKWLTLVLFAYVLAAFLARPDWGAVVRATFVPHVEWSNGYLAVFVGILGTTISPYLFFWQAAQEVEEDRAAGRRTVRQRRGRRGGGLARLPRRYAPPRAAVLRGGGGRDAGRAGPELRGARRGHHAVLVGRRQRSARSAADRARGVAHQRSRRHGQAGEP